MLPLPYAAAAEGGAAFCLALMPRGLPAILGAPRHIAPYNENLLAIN